MPTRYIKLLSIATVLFSGIPISPIMADEEVIWRKRESIYDFTAKTIKGEDISLKTYKGYVCIIVNVASECGYTKNHYDELNELHEKYAASKGLKILAFPCNQFGRQEPGNAEAICSFASKHNVNFAIFDKIDVNGPGTHPLWEYLKREQGGTAGDFIKWNFTKFIVDQNGQPVARFGPNTSPKELIPTLEKYWNNMESRASSSMHYDL